MRYVAQPGHTGSAKPTSLVDLAEILFRHSRSIILIVLASVILTACHLFLIRGESYVAEARLLVRLGQEQAPAPTTIADRSLMVGSQGGYGVGEMEVLRSRDLLTKLADGGALSGSPPPAPTTQLGRVMQHARDLWRTLQEKIDTVAVAAGLKPVPTPREQEIDEIARAFSFKSPPNSNIVIARMASNRRGVAQAGLGSLLDLYFAHRSTLYQGVTATNFFHDRRQETAKRLAIAESALSEFERSHAISNPDEQRTLLLRRIADASASVDAGRLELKAAETALRQFETARQSGDEGLAMLSVPQFSSSLQQSLANELAASAARWLAAQTALGANDQTIRRLRAEMVALSGMLEKQLLASVAEQRDQLASRLALRDASEAQLEKLQAALTEWNELRRTVASSARADEFNDARFNEAQGIAALERSKISNVVVVQQPFEDPVPVGLRKSTMLLLAAAAGMMLALIWVTIREFFDTRLHGPGDVDRRLGLQLLGAVPFDRRGLRRKRPAAGEAEAVITRVAAMVGRRSAEADLRALVVVGGADGEGVTTLTAQLGWQLVRLLGLRVLLVDLAGHSPTLSTMTERLPVPPVTFTLDAAVLPVELTDVEGGWAAAAVTAAEAGPSPSWFSAFIEAAGQAFDLVLVDARSVPDSVATLLALRACGHAMLVASADHLPSETLMQVCDELARERVVMLGCVLNRYRRRVPGWLESALQ